MTHSAPATTDAPAPASPKPTAPSALHEVFDILRTVGLGLLAALCLHAVLFQPFTIPSSSMEPGLVTGDYIVVSKYPYGWSLASPPFSSMTSARVFGRDPARGDVVVFRLPRDPKQTWIKRVVGLPGDTAQVKDGQLFVNGVAWTRTPLGPTRDHDNPDRTVEQVRETQPSGRTYVTYDGGSGLPGDDTPPIIVPQGQYLVMGDNRDNSLDGRFDRSVGVGLLPAGNLMGRAEWIVASWEPGASLFKPWTWVKLQPGRFLRRIP